MSEIENDPLALARLRSRAEAAVDAALKAGATAADAVAMAGVSRSVTLRNGSLEEVESDEEADLGLRVFCGQRAALVGVSERADLSEAAARAVAMANAAPEDNALGLADPDQIVREPALLDIDDAHSLGAEALQERAQAAEAAMLAVAGVTNSGGVSAGSSRSARWIAASNGFSAGYTSTSHSLFATAVAGEGTGMERDSWYSVRRHLAALDHPDEVGRIAAERAIKRVGAERITTRTATVVFEPRAAAGFVQHLISAINGAAVVRGSTFLAGKLGEMVYPAGITVRDDPTVKGGLASRPFDGEGLPANALDIVSDGRLHAYTLDLASARRLGLSPNGRAGRGTGTPSPTATNVTVKGGSGTMQSLMADAGSGLLVTDLIGMGINLVNGSYSRGAAGFWFENGEIVGPVSEITIAGMLPDMFARARFADDAPHRSTVDAPSIAVEGMTIGGR